MDNIFLLPDQGIDDYGRSRSRYQCGNSNPFHSHMKEKYHNINSGNINQIHYDGNIHGYLGISHGPKQCGTGIINCQKGKREGGDKEIGGCTSHDVLFRFPINHPQEIFISNKRDCHNNKCKKQGCYYKLSTGFTGIIRLFLPQILGCYYSASRCQG